MREHLKLLQDQSRNPVSLNDTIICTVEVLPDICAVLILISVCPASGTVVECGFSLKNLIMNDLRRSMNVRTLDATMRIHYQGESLTDGEVNEIIDIWKRRGNRRIEL